MNPIGIAIAEITMVRVTPNSRVSVLSCVLLGRNLSANRNERIARDPTINKMNVPKRQTTRFLPLCALCGRGCNCFELKPVRACDIWENWSFQDQTLVRER